MHSPFVGEFAGTLVLILLGDGVVANVLLKRSKAEGAGWMVIATAWALPCSVRHSYRRGVRQLGRAPQSGGDAGIRHYVGQLREDRSVLDARRSWARSPGRPGVAVLPAALEADGRYRRRSVPFSVPLRRFATILATCSAK